jgi:hypothetical protein
MRLLALLFLTACATENTLESDVANCAQDFTSLRVNEESPLGIDAESLVELIPTQFTTPLFLEGGEVSCLEGSITLDLSSIQYVQSEPIAEDGWIESECLNHIQISASLDLASTDDLLDEHFEIDIILDEFAAQSHILNARFEKEIYDLEGDMGENFIGENLVLTGVIGESNIGMIRLVSACEDCVAEISEERILAAWNDDSEDCQPSD